MNTFVELSKDGTKTVFHSTKGGQQKWTHPWEARRSCAVCRKNKR